MSAALPLATEERVLRPTQSLCPDCKQVRPAQLFVRTGGPADRPRQAGSERAGDDVWIRVDCPEHGRAESKYWQDAQLFEELDEVVGDYVFCRSFECLRGVSCDRCLDKTYNIMLEVTNACNLDCPVCCADANSFLAHRDPSIEEILGRLPPAETGPGGRLKRPNIVLFGGEPTVRKDLPELIEALVGRGYIPRLATNGVRMTDESYLRRLREAGLKWVILQLDGFDDDVSELLRGERHQADKLRAIERMVEHGFKVQLGTMMVKGVNTHYADDLIRFACSHDRIFWLSFYPSSAQSRANLSSGETHVADMLAEIERHTEGRIRARDFVATMRLLRRLERVLRTPNLRQKLSTLPMILVWDGEDYFPLVRLLEPRFAARHARLLPKLLGALPRVLRYQDAYTPPFLKFLIVEKFHADHSIDLEEASNCHMAFMTAEHFVPFDLFNIAYKQSGAWDTAPGPQG